MSCSSLSFILSFHSPFCHLHLFVAWLLVSFHIIPINQTILHYIQLHPTTISFLLLSMLFLISYVNVFIHSYNFIIGSFLFWYSFRKKKKVPDESRKLFLFNSMYHIRKTLTLFHHCSIPNVQFIICSLFKFPLFVIYYQFLFSPHRKSISDLTILILFSLLSQSLFRYHHLHYTTPLLKWIPYQDTPEVQIFLQEKYKKKKLKNKIMWSRKSWWEVR